MKKIKIFTLLIVVFFPIFSFGQKQEENYSQIIQTYYLNKSPILLEKTIETLNNPSTNYKRFAPVMTGFFGALFSSDFDIKNQFNLNLNRFKNPDFKNLFKLLEEKNIDSIYTQTKLSPEYNDMNWSSYFATGDLKYLKNIIRNIPLAENRSDLNLFLTGATAKWSLSSNARNDKKVREYLVGLEENKDVIKEILEKEPHEFQDEMINILRQQKGKGIW